MSDDEEEAPEKEEKEGEVEEVKEDEAKDKKVRWHAELAEQGRSWRRTAEERACLRRRRPRCQGQFLLVPPLHHPSHLLTTAPCTRSN